MFDILQNFAFFNPLFFQTEGINNCDNLHNKSKINDAGKLFIFWLDLNVEGSVCIDDSLVVISLGSVV